MDITKLEGYAPGPWKFWPIGKGYTVECGPNPTGSIAMVDGMRGDMQRANAALVAAAPDLLALAKLGLELAEAVIAEQQAYYDTFPEGYGGSFGHETDAQQLAHSLREKAGVK